MDGGSEDATAPLKMVPSHTAAAKRDEASTSISSPLEALEALERDEILRTRAFSLLVILLAIVGAVAATFLPGGHPIAQRVMYTACALGVLSMAFLLYQTLDPLRFRQRRTTLVWFIPAIAINAPVFYFGVFSAAVMICVLGLYFIGLGKAQRMALVGYAICAVMHAAMALLPITGYPDLGVIRPDLTTTQEIMIEALIQFVLALTIVTARLSRKTALLAVGELERAVRLAAHRQALLVEARDELERALRTKRGRFSEQTLGHYRLGDVIGRGAMGEVYGAIDERDGSPAAVKLLSSPSLANANHVRRFFRELRMAVSVESPHVVRVLEVGEQPVPYLVMERLDGATLAEILRNRRTLAVVEVIELVEQVGIGITAAGSVGVVHRDLKPQNIFRDGTAWKILDFGVARALEHGDTLTAGQVVGTPSYMAPEQATGGEIDHRTDLYALAAVAYRALTGHAPFAANDVAETLYRVVHTRPVRPSLLAPELPRDVDLVLAIGLASPKHERFASAGELAMALRLATERALPADLRARGAALVETSGWF
jgi:hypothetical protein